ncbi:hypothetical protein K501DRAFT_187378, partial [Backusella circina FSU 941]
ECRGRRRKCTRSTLNETCDNCNLFNTVCSFSNENGTISDKTRRSIQDVEDLRKLINQLEAEMETLLTKKHKKRVSHHPLQIQSSPHNQWNITIHNGGFSIETGIRNITDLLAIQPIGYLSPRLSANQSNQDLIVHLNIGKSMRFRRIAAKLLVECVYTKPSPITLPIPASLLFNPRATINHFVDIYFECHNISHPMVHKPTFMEHYNQLQSPFDSLICLSICCVVCTYPCKHISYNYSELRAMSDHFAGLAKSKIADQFDLPEKRLENIIAINLLGEYLFTMLNVSENLNLAALGYQLCQDLKPWYDKECQKPGSPSVECVLFSRHYSTLINYNRLSDVVINKREDLGKIQYVEWKFLPDEPLGTIKAVTGINFIYKLSCHPVIAKIRHYRHFLSKDAVFSLKFADIILVDDIISGFWRHLPAQYHLCESWLDMEEVKSKMNQCRDGSALMVIAYFFSYIADIYATLLTPSDDSLILTVFQERVLKRCLHCSQLLMKGIYIYIYLPIFDADMTLGHYGIGLVQCLIHTLDVLSVLSSSSNYIVKKEANALFSECMNQVNGRRFLETHKVDLLMSPLFTTTKAHDISDWNPAAYYNYSHPWYAALYDICHYLEKMRV